MKNFLMLLFIFSMLITTLHAQTHPVPTTMAHDGEVNFNGGTFTMTFRLFNSPTGGTPIWQETQTGVVVNKKLYSVVLGSVHPLSPNHFAGDIYLEVQVANNAPISPRKRFHSLPYAFKAGSVSDGSISTSSLMNGAVTDAKIHGMDWSKLLNVPNGFADGIDNDTIYSAGAGLSLNNNIFSILNGGVTDSMIQGMSWSKLIGVPATS